MRQRDGRITMPTRSPLSRRPDTGAPGHDANPTTSRITIRRGSERLSTKEALYVDIYVK